MGEQYVLNKEISIRSNLRRFIYWPFKMSQSLGCFPFLLSPSNEYVFKLKGLSTVWTLLFLVVSCTFSISCFFYREEILTKTMGRQSSTEAYAVSLMYGFCLVLDKLLIIYTFIFRKSIINFQRQFNKVMEDIVNNVTKIYPTLFAKIRSGTCYSPWNCIERNTKPFRKLGLVLLLCGILFEISVIVFHMTVLVQPESKTWRNFWLFIICAVGDCSMSLPRLCFLYFIGLKICILKSTFKMLSVVGKRIGSPASSNGAGNQVDTKTLEIETFLDMYNRLENLILRLNTAFGVQLLVGVVMSLIVVTGLGFVICVNIYISWECVVMLAIPLTTLHLTSLVLLCHNASVLTVAVC